MKRLTYLILMAISCMALGCHKDAQLTTLAPVAFTSAVNASTKQVILSAATDSTPAVLTLKWPAVIYPVKAHVTYTLQVDKPADTVGASAWANATAILIGNDVLTKAFKGADLNTLALAVGITANDTANMVFRVQAYQDRAVYTHGVTVSVSPWKPAVVFSHGWPVLWIPGDYQGWSPGTAPTVAAEQTNIYEGYIYQPAGGTHQFKFTNAQDWNHINYGDAGNGTLTTDGNAAGMTLPGAGYYELVCNPVTLTWNYTLTTWGIIGDATPGGWNSDTQMSYDPIKQVWSVTCNMVASGSFKFRANNAWSIDFGVDANGKLAYADNPAYPYNGSLGNLTVPSSGNYTITLDLHDPNNYNFTLKKN
ncbi:SusE domain-containing protein [Mucilaginibacter gossypiicola]|nr:SusE domain-containing protein [Mucilaginibacter gossypiicola]